MASADGRQPKRQRVELPGGENQDRRGNDYKPRNELT